jgi:hypothetical protein
MQKVFKVYALLSIALLLSSCALFKRKPEIVHVDERVFLVDQLIKDVNIDGSIVTLINPFFPDDKAIIISAEKFKKVIGTSIDSITEKDVKKALGV